jgi:Twin arginine targeting (Tat) protein translocase TatC
MRQLETDEAAARGGQMGFLDHLDELRKRLMYSAIIIVCAFVVAWFFKETIYNFLAVPAIEALGEAVRRDVPLSGLTGDEKTIPLNQMAAGEKARYVFDQATKLGTGVVQPGTSIAAVVATDSNGQTGLFTDEAIITGTVVIPRGVKLPVEISTTSVSSGADERLIVTTPGESFTLYVTQSLYAAVAFSVPLLLWQIWAFISPALYKHERAYVTPFVLLSTISFVVGAAFAYYVLLPPALGYLLGLAEDFRPLLRASDYFDFVTIVLLAMGAIFQMPAITYVLARIGLVTPSFLIKSWKMAVVIILIVAALVSPTGDIPNLVLFASPMMVLYVFSIGIAWLFGKKRQTDAETI